LDGVVLYICDRDQLYSSTSELPMSIQASLRAMTESHNPAQTVPGGFMAMTLMLGLRPVGALALRPSVLSHEVATAVSAQVAIALTRAMAIEASTRMEASREGERLRTALIDSLTHELRTPLTSIRAAATTLIDSDGLDDASRLDLATIVDEEASRLDRLIGEAVEMAEIDAQVVKVSPVAQRPRTLLDQAVAESHVALARHRENAARYSPPGSRITLRSRRAGGRLEFCVEDNGPGIGPVDLPLIFEKFYRGREGTASRKGTGMGLAIVRALLIAHGGAIEAASTRKEGTSFRFWVPLVEENPASELAALQTGNIQVLEKQS
jgi:two-component system sensor histidine kinase KdpD